MESFPASQCNFPHNNWLIYYFVHVSWFLFWTGDYSKNEFNKVGAVKKLRQVDAPITALIYMEMEMVTNQFHSFEWILLPLCGTIDLTPALVKDTSWKLTIQCSSFAKRFTSAKCCQHDLFCIIWTSAFMSGFCFVSVHAKLNTRPNELDTMQKINWRGPL